MKYTQLLLTMIVSIFAFASSAFAAESPKKVSIKTHINKEAFPYQVITPDIEVEVGGKRVLMTYYAILVVPDKEVMFRQLQEKGYRPANNAEQAAFMEVPVIRRIGSGPTVDKIISIGKAIGAQTACIVVVKKPVQPKK